MNSSQHFSFSSKAVRDVVPRGGRSFDILPVLCVVAAMALTGCGNKDQQQGGGPGGPGGPAGQALPVTVIEAQLRRVPVNIEAVGQSEGSKEVQVRARVSGILLKQRYTEGDRVKSGAVLFQIDPAPYEIALAQARAALAQARATLDQSQREEDRLKPLAAEQAISGREYDTAISTRKTSQAQMMARQADVRGADLNLGYTKVIAPISGVTGRAINSEGSLVTSGTDSSLLTTISQTDPIWIRFSFAEPEYARVRSNERNAQVHLLLADGKQYAEAGKLNFAASTVDRTLGTIQLRAEVPNSALAILPGQFVRVRVTIGDEEVFLVPQSAVSTSDRGKSVWVVGPDNKATPRPVEVGEWQGASWAIRKGLQPGDKVIIDNLVKLRPDAPVAPHPPQAAPAGGPPQPGQPQGQTPAQAPAQAAPSKGGADGKS